MINIRVRFAPSPTGHLHVGGARTALFNYLFAKKYNGTFILRIEDTDEIRSTEESIKSIFDSMRWLGLTWDEGAMFDLTEKGNFGPYIQSEREKLGIYRKYADELLKAGKAYYCYCTTEELEEQRKKALLEKRPVRGYEGKCRNLTKKQIEDFEKQGRIPALRFKMPGGGVTQFNDLIHKELKFENNLLYDFVILKASGYPTYNFACVIDDHLMEISTVIRGDDHISNTPLQINLYKALGWNLPEFAHLSMILGPDGTRLSKRHGATSIQEYKRQGYLPQTMKNYLALLGWSTSDSQQIFEEGELEKKFDLNGCQKNPAIFDNAKLKWMNGEYIRKLSSKELIRFAMPFIKESGINIENKSWEEVVNIIILEQEKYKLLSDIPKLIDFFFNEVNYNSDAVDKVFKNHDVKTILGGIKQVYASLQNWTEHTIESETRNFAKANGFKTGQVFHPVRLAVSGRTEGPTLFKMLAYLGKEETIRRIDKAITLI